MKWTAFIIALLIFLSLCALGQLDQYYPRASGDVPMPTTPASPESLGIQAPPPTESSRAPGSQELYRGLMRTSQQFAYSAPRDQKQTTTSPAYTQLVVPPGEYAPNSLYVSYAPQTVAGCYPYTQLPLWLQASSSGYAWLYEWYLSGQLDINYAGYIYSPSWYKRWFFVDVPGWHILQYYCNGWSNYVYIYVYDRSPDYWMNSTSYDGSVHSQYSSFQSGQVVTPPSTFSYWPPQQRLSGALPISAIGLSGALPVSVNSSDPPSATENARNIINAIEMNFQFN